MALAIVFVGLLVFCYCCVFIFVPVECSKQQAVRAIEAIENSVDDDIVDAISAQFRAVAPQSVAFTKQSRNFDASIQCAMHLSQYSPGVVQWLFTVYPQLTESMPLDVRKSVEGVIYLLCESTDKKRKSNGDGISTGFREWLLMADEEQRLTIERIVLSHTQKALKKKTLRACLRYISKRLAAEIYGRLYGQYPATPNMMEMIHGIFLNACAKAYPSPEKVREVMQYISSMDDAPAFFNMFQSLMDPELNAQSPIHRSSFNSCVESAPSILFSLENYLLLHHYQELKFHPLHNSIIAMIETGCEKHFLHNDRDMHPEL